MEQTQHGGEREPGTDWAAWLQRHGGKLFYFAVHWNAEDPEDALQHTMVQTARAVAEGRCVGDDTSILRYAYTTLRHRLSRVRREGMRRRIGESAWGQGMCLLQSDEATVEECRKVEAALRQLPAEEAELIVLHVWEGMTFLEIAELLELNRNTVASRYRKALTAIRELLDHFTE